MVKSYFSKYKNYFLIFALYLILLLILYIVIGIFEVDITYEPLFFFTIIYSGLLPNIFSYLIFKKNHKIVSTIIIFLLLGIIILLINFFYIQNLASIQYTDETPLEVTTGAGLGAIIYTYSSAFFMIIFFVINMIIMVRYNIIKKSKSK